ncbi:hypothetical protein NDU88_001037 [Pleurodeles waltl]|uniref:Uncharacterized protein n=1 Tax=Pleurodeles waltl TaxID=8319 RepID=A0AAV7S685_PLEWA|nr:hypothetical protein NDU88_001037 [Pleurodeles waltl]
MATKRAEHYVNSRHQPVPDPAPGPKAEDCRPSPTSRPQTGTTGGRHPSLHPNRWRPGTRTLQMAPCHTSAQLQPIATTAGG